MKDVIAAFGRFAAEEEGVTMVEYGLIAALVSIIAIGALAAMGTNLKDMFQRIADCVKTPSANC